MMTTDLLKEKAAKHPRAANGSLQISEVLRQYGCGPIPFVGAENAFYERHLIFDRVIDPESRRLGNVSRHLPTPSATSWRNVGC